MVINISKKPTEGSFDKNGPDEKFEVPYYQHIFLRRIFYLLTVLFTRLSILTYYLRIFPPALRSLRILSYTMIGFVLSHWIAVLTLLLVQCRAIHLLWTSEFASFRHDPRSSHCFSSATYSYTAAIGDTILDCSIFMLPIPYIWGLRKLCIRQRIGLVVVFSLGFTVCVVALLQIPFIQRRRENGRYFGTGINLLVAIQLSLAIVAASLPDIRALVARVWPKFAPLRHGAVRSVCSGERDDEGDVEAGNSGSKKRKVSSSDECPRTIGEGPANKPKRPDWLRSTIPRSLMSTRRGSSASVMVVNQGNPEDWNVPARVDKLEKIETLGTVEELPTPESSKTS